MKDIDKLSFYKQTFDLSDEELSKMVKTLPQLLGLDTKSIKSKIEFYKQTFDLSDGELSKIVKTSPALLSYNTESVSSKIEFYEQTFNLKPEELSKMVKNLPALLSYNTESVSSKIEFYKETFDLSDEELSKMVKTLPTLLGLDTESDGPTSVKSKVEKLESIGVTPNHIKNSPQMLTFPAQRIRFRYMLLSQFSDDEEIFSGNVLMISEAKLYARLGFFVEQGIKLKLSDLVKSEKIFQKIYNKTSEELMKAYPLSKDAIENIEKEYNKSNSKQINLTETEKEELER